MNHRPATSSVLVAVCAAFCATGFGVEVAAAQDQAVSPNALEDEPLPKGLVLGGDGFPRLEPHLEEVLRRGGWPPNLGEIPALTDILLRRGEDPLVGDLQLLGAFALVTLPELQQGDAPSRSSSDRQERVPRNNIAAILPNGRAFPDRLPLLPPDEDAVVLVDGSLHTGSVQIATPNVTVGARTFQEGQVALVHLGVSPNPDDFQQAREAGQPDDTRSGEDPPPPERDPTGDTPPEGGRPGFGLGGPRISPLWTPAAGWAGSSTPSSTRGQAGTSAGAFRSVTRSGSLSDECAPTVTMSRAPTTSSWTFSPFATRFRATARRLCGRTTTL